MIENEYAPIPDEINIISQAVIDGAYKVHKALGAGLLDMNPVFDAQLLTYLKLTNIRVGLLINFNSPVIKKGIKRLVL